MPRLTGVLDIPMAADAALRGEGFPPGADIEVEAAFEDAAGVRWLARTRFESDGGGGFKFTSPSRAGAPSGDVGALFWSATPQGGEDAPTYLQRALEQRDLPLTPAPDPLGVVQYTLRARTKEGVATTPITLRRRRLPQDVRAEVVNEGALRGMFFEPEGGARCAMLVIGGSEGGLIPTRAAQLAGEGIAALALAYHQYPDLPQAAYDLPIEHFARGLQWLRARVGHARTGMFGASRGSEAAVLTAQLYPEFVRALVVLTPTHIINTGLDALGMRDFREESRAMWSHGGMAIEGAPFSLTKFEAGEAFRAGLAAPPGWRYAEEFRRLWRTRGVETRYALPVSAIRAPSLLLAPDDDGLWPGDEGAERLADLLAKHSQAPRAEIEVIVGAGHTLGVPNEAQPFVRTRIWRDGYFGVEGGFIDVGGAPAASAAGARQAWRRTIGFIHAALS